MSDRSGTFARSGALPFGVALLAVLSLVVRGPAVEHPGPEPEDLRADREVSEWTRGWKSSWGEVHVRVDPGFEHPGPAWADGNTFAKEGSATLEWSDGPERRLHFSAGEWFQGTVLTLFPTWNAAGERALEVGASTWSDAIGRDGSSGDVATGLGGRVRVSSLDWDAVEAVHLEFQLRISFGDYVAYLRGAASVETSR